MDVCGSMALVAALVGLGPWGVVVWLLLANRSLMVDLHGSLTRSGGGGENPHS